MSKIDSMPPMCHDCPRWELCEFPYVCPDTEQTKQPEQKHGHWVLDPDGMDWNIPAWICSECACRNDNLPVMKDVTPKTIMRFSGSKFCPNCGAKMDGTKGQ